MDYDDLMPEANNPLTRMIHRFAVFMLESVEPLAKLLSPKAKPFFHAVWMSMAWMFLMLALAPFSSAGMAWYLLFGVLFPATNYLLSTRYERLARPGDHGLVLERIRRLRLDLMLSTGMVFILSWGESVSSLAASFIALLLIWVNDALLCFTGGPGLMEKIRERQAARASKILPAGV